MKKTAMRILGGVVVVLLIMVAPALAPPNPFAVCAPTGHDCNILITLTKQGFLQVDSNPNMPYFPRADGTFGDIGSLIGFKNSSSGTIYSLSFSALPNAPYEGKWICSQRPDWIPAIVSFRNIEETANVENPPYYYYNACSSGSCPNPRRTKCDVVFAGGIPKSGSTYFSMSTIPSNLPWYWQVVTNTVIPSVSFQDTLVIEETGTATLTLFPPNPASVTLTLTTTEGEGSAVFAANNSTTMTITASTPVQIQIKGVTESSVPNNIRLTASVAGQQRETNFTVRPPTLQVSANGNVISNLSTVYITTNANGDPVMPTLAARLVSSGPLTGIAAWSLVVDFTGADNVMYYSRSFLPSPDGTLPANQTWNISTGSILGGLATVRVDYGSWSNIFSFYIVGDYNYPTIPQAQSYITSNSGQWWFLTYIGSHETTGGSCVSSSSTGYHQFNIPGTPCFGPPHGFGMMQIDPPNGTSQQVEGVLWDYRNNVAASVEILDGKAFNDPNPNGNMWGAYHFWSRPVDGYGGGQLEQWLTWNATPSNTPVGVPSGQYANPGPNCPFGLNLDGTVPAGSRSWADAILIKMYNGSPSGNYIYWDNVTSPQNPMWGFHPTEPQSGNYVQSICTQ